MAHRPAMLAASEATRTSTLKGGLAKLGRVTDRKLMGEFATLTVRRISTELLAETWTLAVTRCVPFVAPAEFQVTDAAGLAVPI